jgi:hypothetical protein
MTRKVNATLFNAVIDADAEFKKSKNNLERELRAELEKRLATLRANRALAVRRLHASIEDETGRTNYAALGRALSTKDHLTVKAILSETESLQTAASDVTGHPDDSLITHKADGKFTLTDGSKTYTFGLQHGEYVGVSVDEMDELDNLNAVERVTAWQARNEE